ncbi:MAG: CRISPR-associated endonuclease Cas1 [Candidatus Eremiobacteraeota bacterium]|nr:CRISPR-associated endonuclease Cas1 [Candidatus Eremiobacteraeota bacterium]
MINQFVYCPRLFYLEWVQGEFRDSADTLEGRFRHQNVDRQSGDMKENAGEDERIHASSVMLSGERSGIIAKMDLIEGKGKTAIPVDYKKGKPPNNPDKIWEADQAQLCAQAMVLRENGFTCNEGILYYISTKKRVRVQIDSDLVAETLSRVRELRETAARKKPPPPLVDSPKCPGCSLVGICLPDEVGFLGEPGREKEIRRLYPARDDAYPLIVQKQGAFVGKSGEEIAIKEKGRKIASARFIDISSLCLFGNIQVSSQLVRELMKRNIPICYFSYGGWFQGVTSGYPHKNIELRILQYDAASNRTKSLEMAKEFVGGKIRNCRTLLRRNSCKDVAGALESLNKLAKKAEKAESSEILLGIEGSAAAMYFSAFQTMLKNKSGDDEFSFQFNHRNRRPPRDPVNALLSFAYAILTREIFTTLLRVGFDPYLGFYHCPKYGRPALALDLIEEFRPIICDSVVITVINNGEITGEDFIARAGSVALKKPGRKKFLEAFYRRLDCLVTHPVFGYKISYRRVLEVQSRLLARLLTGEIPNYPPFVTR